MTPPTDRQLEIVEFMRSHQRTKHMPPTLREICDAFDFASTNAARDMLQRLVRKHLVEYTPNIARGYRALSPSTTGEV